MYTKIVFQVCVLACLWCLCACQRAEKLLAQNPCTNKMTCSDCIRTPSCGWCYQGDFKEARCFNESMGRNGCDEQFIFYPHSDHNPVDDRPLSKVKGRSSSSFEQSMSSQGGSFAAEESFGSSAGSSFAAGSASASDSSNLVPIRPQKVQLKLRMNEMHTLKVWYSQAEDYPVDLYYLMDLSYSMKDDKEKLSALGNLLSSTMQNITNNFRIGFGSFVDKVVMPYVSTVPSKLKSPCDGCAAPYGYINQMPLSKDTGFFVEAVDKSQVSGNLDGPEGGFDAIMQAAVCKQQIGWRDQARRLLVFSTDAGFHYAGDGKLGGIVLPNDGECYLDGTGTYTHSTVQDYPSISQINVKMKQHAINLIFAVTAEQIEVYRQLSKMIEGSSAGELTSDSSNVVDLVKDQYDKITSKVEMKDNSTSAVQVVYYSSCLGDKNDIQQTNQCDGLKVGDIVEFTAEITLKECPKDPREWKQVFHIQPVGVSDNMVVELEMLCDCPCEHPGHFAYKTSSDVCNGHGTSACGICVCDADRYGKSCECGATSDSSIDQERGCRSGNSTGPPCSNRGNCNCGQCDCFVMPDPTQKISGPFCECDNFSCDRKNGFLCSNHGECVCNGECKCDSGYTGTACQCSLDTTNCTGPDGQICSGHGDCECGECKCHTSEERRYSGVYCESCPTCDSGYCGHFKDCVLCRVHNYGPEYNEDAPVGHQCENCTQIITTVKEKLEANETINEHMCSFYDDRDCLYVFTYHYDENHILKIRAQEKMECPAKVVILGIVLGVIAAIVLVGLALLMLWKMVTTIHDRREFARFEKERMMAKWDTGENPIYKQATSTFKNPTYAGK